MKRTAILVILALFGIQASVSQVQVCREIHGRAISYSGDGFLEIWHIGTHHTFFVVDEKSTDLIMDFIPYRGSDHQDALFADFTICPTDKYRKGASQATIIKRIRKAHVVLDFVKMNIKLAPVNIQLIVPAPRFVTGHGFSRAVRDTNKG